MGKALNFENHFKYPTATFYDFLFDFGGFGGFVDFFLAISLDYRGLKNLKVHLIYFFTKSF